MSAAALTQMDRFGFSNLLQCEAGNQQKIIKPRVIHTKLFLAVDKIFFYMVLGLVKISNLSKYDCFV